MPVRPAIHACAVRANQLAGRCSRHRREVTSTGWGEVSRGQIITLGTCARSLRPKGAHMSNYAIGRAFGRFHTSDVKRRINDRRKRNRSGANERQ